MAKYKQLTVKLPDHVYPVYIGNGLLSDVELLRHHVKSGQVLVVTNPVVAPLYLGYVLQACHSIQCDVIEIGDGEVHKNQHSLFTIYDALIKYQHHRDTTIIALGGGVVGDIAGFAAATYQRGVRFVQIPTTLLAQVDSSVGGKTAINYRQAKNMIGSFYQPHAVIMDLNTLSTLPSREFQAGLAEVIKCALIVGGDFLITLHSALNSKKNTFSSINNLPDIILTCCQIKAGFVQDDQHEAGCRVLLNLGHTFAHALEAYTHYQRWLHGEAVAIGLYCASLLSFHLGYIEQADLDLVDELLEHAQLPRRIPKDVDLQILRSLMFKDKKVTKKTLRFVLIKGFGHCYLDETITDTDLSYVMSRAVEETNAIQ